MSSSVVITAKHVHLLLTPEKDSSAGELMKRLGQRYVQYVNRTYNPLGGAFPVMHHTIRKLFAGLTTLY